MDLYEEYIKGEILADKIEFSKKAKTKYMLNEEEVYIEIERV